VNRSVNMAERRERARPSTLIPAALMTYGTNLATSVLSLTQVLIVARALGPAGRGKVAFLITVCAFASQIASLGIQEANANIGGSDPRARARLATNSLIAAVVLGLLSAAVVLGLVDVVPAAGGHVDPWLLRLTLLGIPIVILKLYLQLLLQSDYRFGITNAAWLAGPLTTAVTNGIGALCGFLTVGTAVGMWLAGQAIGLVLLALHVRRHIGFAKPDFRLGRSTLSFGLKTHLGRFMAMGTYRVDQWIVGAISGPRELGLYSIAVAWSEVLMYVPGVVVLLQRPDLVRAGRGSAAPQAAQICRRVAVLSVVAAGVLIVLAPFLCTTVFGARFAGSVIDLRILALSAPGIVLLSLLSNAVIAQRRPLRASIAEGVALVFTLALCGLLIPGLGGRGAAIATTVAYTVGGAVMAVVFARSLDGSVRDLLPQPADVVWYFRKARALAGTVALHRRAAT
jgi:O-antigen/teichoic acid export membrane protein